MKPYLATVLVVLTAAGGATVRAGSGDQWVPADEAIEPVVESEASDYDLAMEEGDAAALLAVGGAASPATIKKKIELAVRAYQRAAKADPKAAEPHYRAGNVLYGFYIDCDMGSYRRDPLCDNDNPKLFRRVLEQWHAFETKAPLDPRVNAILFDRAILHTKLATEDDLRAAVLDYQALLDRSTQTADLSTVYGNLAESYMMLGDLDQAIPNYQEALRAGGQTSIAYGLAVAYDRDDQGAKAREIFAAYGETQFETFREEINSPDALTFFVPEGEEFYYLALGYESLGRDAEAVTAWKRFLASGAHPSYQPRAREHLTKLKAKLKAAGGK
jgi:tetratricopeptide (TPR) repeat protein